MNLLGAGARLRWTLDGVTLVLLLMAGPVGARPPANGTPIDAAACARTPRAASLITSAYLTLPSKHNATAPAYVYVVASDLSEQLYPLFPDKEGSALRPYRETQLVILGGTEYLHLDNRPGTDYFLVLYSTRPLDFSALVRRMQAAEGALGTRLQAALARDMLSDAEVDYTAAAQIDFRAKSAARSAVPVIVELQHLQ